MRQYSVQYEDARASLARALLSLLVVVSIGTIGYMLIEGWDVWTSLFFTVISITTVGYGDYGLTEMGERFTAVLLLGGLGVATYSLSQMVSAAVRMRPSVQDRMIRKAKRMSSQFIVCGLGQVGQHICESLIEVKHDFVAIDMDKAVVERMVALGGTALVGDATCDEILLLAGVEDAKCIACVTQSDADNIVIALSARHLNADIKIIGRVDCDSNVLKCERAGSDITVSPARSGAHQIVQCMLNPGLANILSREPSENGFSLIEVKVEQDSELEGVTILEYGSAHPELIFVAHARGGAVPQHRPSRDEVLAAGDTLIVAGGLSELAICTRDAAAELRRAAA
ncbi:MAG: potassium channel protein [Planctomycetes bacterium]|nr:potassium channel protein [Planctomycetota bacterium]NOG55410.1 potassium channel protein [Planctomycetota bacterium]